MVPAVPGSSASRLTPRLLLLSPVRVRRMKACPGCGQNPAAPLFTRKSSTARELRYFNAKLAAQMPFGKVADFLNEVLPDTAATNYASAGFPANGPICMTLPYPVVTDDSGPLLSSLTTFASRRRRRGPSGRRFPTFTAVYAPDDCLPSPDSSETPVAPRLSSMPCDSFSC